MDLENRHCVVTGGTGALGAAVVHCLSAAGATCHVAYTSEPVAERLRARAVPRLHLARCDMTDEGAVARFYGAVPAPWASVHVVGGFAFGPLEDLDKAAFDRLIAINLTTCFLGCRAAVKAMAMGGRIVNVAARPALEWRQGKSMAAYAATKAAVAALTVALAEEVVGRNILVNAVAPSIIDTPANRAAMPDADHNAWPKVEDVAAVIGYLASPDNRITRGAVVPVYGRA